MESVWSYPRTPTFVAERRPVRVEFAGIVVAETEGAVRVLERGLPPSFYVPAGDVRTDLLVATGETSLCPVKGEARYWTIRVGEREALRAAWSYPETLAMAAAIQGHYCFDVNRVDRCLVGSLVARGRENPFYGGWVTSDVEGPFVGDADLPEDLLGLLPRPVISQGADDDFAEVAARSHVVGRRFLPPEG